MRCRLHLNGKNFVAGLREACATPEQRIVSLVEIGDECPEAFRIHRRSNKGDIHVIGLAAETD